MHRSFNSLHLQGATERLSNWVEYLLPYHLGDVNLIWMENLETSFVFGIPPATLKRWRREGQLRCYLVSGNRISFPLCEVVHFLGLENHPLFAGLKKTEERGFAFLPVEKNKGFS